MLLIRFIVGFADANCYLVACERKLEALIIDPGFGGNEWEPIHREIMKHNLQVKYVVNTHGHVDHISGNLKVKEKTGARILVHYKDAEMLTNPILNLSKMVGLTVISPPPDKMLRDGDKIRVGSLEFKVIHTPGHTPGSISFYCREEKAVFTGDTLFAGSIGRTDFPGGSYEKLISSIRGKLLTLPDETAVYPGHGEKTTIEKEKRLLL
ncbi:MBL fold metallo-hydrolase [Candidatus Bathyarchaeota archaeon]|nr:MBL fold metallo-hydrolase [Candidatus Bathyarchaeota archaeon]